MMSEARLTIDNDVLCQMSMIDWHPCSGLSAGCPLFPQTAYYSEGRWNGMCGRLAGGPGEVLNVLCEKLRWQSPARFYEKILS